MAMNDEETVALIAGGHSFANSRRGLPAQYVGPNPKVPTSRIKALGGRTSLAKALVGTPSAAAGSHLDHDADEVEHNFFTNLFSYEWELTKSPAGAHQWTPKNGAGNGTVPDAHDPSKRHSPSMLTTDLALRFDPAYEKISRRFYEHPDQLADAFARAWFKLTHATWGRSRGTCPLVPKEPQPFQDPFPPWIISCWGEGHCSLKARS